MRVLEMKARNEVRTPARMTVTLAEKIFLGEDLYRRIAEHAASVPEANHSLRRTFVLRPPWRREEQATLRLPAVLRAEHRVLGFRSGCDRLDCWLDGEALQAQRQGQARTFVVASGLRVDGFATVEAVWLCLSGKAKADCVPIPAALLRGIAVDRQAQGAGMGRGLVADMLRRIEQAADQLGIGVVLARAENSSQKDFWLELGFEDLGEGWMQITVAEVSKAMEC